MFLQLCPGQSSPVPCPPPVGVWCWRRTVLSPSSSLFSRAWSQCSGPSRQRENIFPSPSLSNHLTGAQDRRVQLWPSRDDQERGGGLSACQQAGPSPLHAPLRELLGLPFLPFSPCPPVSGPACISHPGLQWRTGITSPPRTPSVPCSDKVVGPHVPPALALVG